MRWALTHPCLSFAFAGGIPEFEVLMQLWVAPSVNGIHSEHIPLISAHKRPLLPLITNLSESLASVRPRTHAVQSVVTC